ncbi:PAS domain-containing protein [Flavisolibacter sp. BT320]|nr:PAS domain-containing protein [Flavisolibacter longurius]
MQTLLDFFSKLFDTADWPPRWYCGNWTDFHGWLYIISDLLIWSAYFAIPITILRFISRRHDAKFVRAYFLFAAFILACGTTHFLDAVTFWFPAYRLNALVRFVTGVVSWATVLYLIKILPVANSLRSHAELEKEITERKRVEGDLVVANEQLNAAQEIAKLGHWQWDVVANKVTWSNELCKMYGIPVNEMSYESYLQKVHPDDRDFVNAAVEKAFAEKKFPSYTHRILFEDGSEKVVQARGEVQLDENDVVVRMMGTGQDITEIQKAQQQLVERTHALETSNAELQRFAYVTSHDLQEPLRKIVTFASLLEKEANGSLNEKGSLYMDKIVQSAGRMQRLIDDILAFSSLRVSNEAFVPTDLNTIVKQVISDMEVAIEETGASIQLDKLPVIDAVPSQMEQLFQNLISNAIKFGKNGEAPQISISCKMVGVDDIENYNLKDETMLAMRGFTYNWSREQFVQVEITDNGIGFDQTYAEQIFEIFQRLHSQQQVQGTGIGLAICKKIVDIHHGTISAQSIFGEGAKFQLNLPVSQKLFIAAQSPVPA